MKQIILPWIFTILCGYIWAQETQPLLLNNQVSYSKPVAGPYNENQDVRTDLKNAIDQANRENKHVIIQFGGNWCPWCIRFHNLMKGDIPTDSILKASYIYVLANVPKEREKRDWDLFREYDYPNRFGFPVFVILGGNGKKLHIQDSGVLEHCQVKGYDTTQVISFLKMWTPVALSPETYQKK